MSLLIWVGLVFFSCSWLFVFEVFARPDPVLAGLCFGAAATFLGTGTVLASRRSASLVTLLASLVASTMAVLAVTPLFFFAGSRVHRLDFLSPLVHGSLNFFGLDAFLSEGVVHVRTAVELLPLTTTWEKLGLVPAGWFLLSSLVFLLLFRTQAVLGSAIRVLAATIVYLVVRYVTLIVLFLDHPDPRNLSEKQLAIRLFSDPANQLLSFLPLALVLSVFVPWTAITVPWRRQGLLRPKAVFSLMIPGLGAAALVAFFQYQDPGTKKEGRILLDELHSPRWESATRPLSTEWYGRESVYSYATLAAYLRQFYRVDVNEETVYTEGSLENVDVLVLKTATRPFEEGEVEAIQRFVRSGGGLLLVGDHTNLLGMSTNLNKVSRRFGIEFNLDAANRLDDGRFYEFHPSPLLSHAAVSSLSSIRFMTSCTLKADWSAENVILAGNSFSDPVDYSAPSFFGNVIPDSEDDFGVHLFAAAKKVGRGRMLAFSDSTIFSSFGMMHGERPDLLLGMLDYLNRSNATGYWVNRACLVVFFSCVLWLLFLWIRRARSRVWWGAGVPVAVGLGQLACSGTLTAMIAGDYELPEAARPVPCIAFLEDGGDYSIPDAFGDERAPPHKAFDTFFLGTQRLGYLPRTLALDDALDQGDALVVINPTIALTSKEKVRIGEFVWRGGKLLVMDSLLNRASTSNSFLQPFGLRVGPTSHVELGFPCSDALTDQEAGRSHRTCGDEHPVVASNDSGLVAKDFSTPSLSLRGGQALFETTDGRVLAAGSSFGQGRVVGLVDSILFSRLHMGNQTDAVEPGGSKWEVFQMEYELFQDHLFSRSRVSAEHDARECTDVVAEEDALSFRAGVEAGEETVATE